MIYGDEVVQVDFYLGQVVHPHLRAELRPLFIVVWLVRSLFGVLCVYCLLEGVWWGVVTIAHGHVCHILNRRCRHA